MMLWRLSTLLLTLLALMGSAGAITDPFDITIAINATSQPFSLPTGHVLHYISPTGSDSNNGTSPATAWASPNHALSCGDVIIMAAGAYTGMNPTSGTPSNCPSTSGGIDGTGGIWFAIVLCAGDLGASTGCTVTGSVGVSGSGINNWAFEGIRCTNPGTSFTNRCFNSDTTSGSAPVGHHIALINDFAFANGQGYHWDQGGQGGSGWDYIAVVGSIAQDSTQESDSFQGSAFDAVNMLNHDTNPGTHVYFFNNYGINNRCTTGCSFDSEGIMFDTWDGDGLGIPYTGLGIIANNLVYHSSTFCVEIFAQGGSTNEPNAQMNMHNNTCYDNLIDVVSIYGGAGRGELSMDNNGGTTATTWYFRTALINNIALSAVSGNYALALTPSAAATGSAMTQIGNITNSNPSVTSCGWPSCDRSSAPISVGTNGGFAIDNADNSYSVNVTFANTSDLLANQIGVPNCAGFTSTTACMGWNSVTGVLTSPSVIADLSPNCPGLPNSGNAQWCGGKGFQPPSTTCSEATSFTGSISGTTLTVSGTVTGLPIGAGQLLVGAGITTNTIITAGSGTSWTVNNSQTVGSETIGATYYPYWLKGINRLQWHSGTSTITEESDLATKPCGM